MDNPASTRSSVAQGLQARTRAAALGVTALCRDLTPSFVGKEFGRQLLRSATSAAANYRAAARARSRREFIAKMSLVIEEADETLFWLEMLAGAGLVEATRINNLHNEFDQILAMAIASRITARRRLNEARRTT